MTTLEGHVDARLEVLSKPAMKLTSMTFDFCIRSLDRPTWKQRPLY
jgi:hypothetical protein